MKYLIPMPFDNCMGNGETKNYVSFCETANECY